MAFNRLPTNSAKVAIAGSQPVQAVVRSRLDLGQVHVVELVFPTLLGRGTEFEISSAHDWPGSMAPGLDIMWYPYGAMFKKGVDSLDIELTFDTPVHYIRGYEANFASLRCEIYRDQPQPRGTTQTEYEWKIGAVDNDSVYIAVFDRG